jgi:hypothetical protein
MIEPLEDFDCGPIWQALDGTDMKRVTQMRLYRLGSVNRLRQFLKAGEPPERFRDNTETIVMRLRAFCRAVENKDFTPNAVDKAGKLAGAIQRWWTDRSDVREQEYIDYLETLLISFESSLEDDLTRLPTYVVEQVGAYSSDELIASAIHVIPRNIRRTGVLPQQTLTDVQAAGACLAFDLPTACAFHVFRATDAMLRKYCEHFGGVLKGGGRDWGKYIGALRDVCGSCGTKKPNIRTVELLDSIRAQDRNPLVHPELNLDSDGALAVFDLCINAVSLMALDIIKSKTSSDG